MMNTLVDTIKMTFGGSWSGNDRTKINNWNNNPNIGGFNNEARRVSQGMWEYISSQTCVSPNSAVPTQTCSQNNDW